MRARQNAFNEPVVAHEFTHALQDEYHDPARLDSAAVDTDRRMATHAVLEGDATFTSERRARGALDEDVVSPAV